MIYELPPAPQGGTEQQLAALRDYLVRLSGELTRGGKGTGAAVSPLPAAQRAAQRAQTAVGPSAETLKALIIKNANAADAAIARLGEQIEGIDGQYFYIRYAPCEQPTAEQMSAAPREDTAYMGVCSTGEEAAPTDPEAYVWSRVLGKSALSVQIESTNGSIFKNGAIATVLRARVFSGDEDITALFDDNDFRWTRVSADAEADARWNSEHFGGSREITLGNADVFGRATFFCAIRDGEET